MSVNIHWRPTDDNGASFNSGTSSDLEKLKQIFPNGRIKEDGIGKLRAMEIASGSKFYGEVADVVEQFKDIKFWGVW